MRSTYNPFAYWVRVSKLNEYALLKYTSNNPRSIIIDYLPEKRVPKSRLAAGWGLRAATLLVAVGLYEFETNDVGITEAVKRVWTA